MGFIMLWIYFKCFHLGFLQKTLWTLGNSKIVCCSSRLSENFDLWSLSLHSNWCRMCAGLSKWAVIRVRRNEETIDYELNIRGQLVNRPPRQARRSAPYGLAANNPSGSKGSRPRLRVARLALPSTEKDSGGFGTFCEEKEEQNKEQSFNSTNTQEDFGSSLLGSEQYLGFETDEFAFSFGFESGNGFEFPTDFNFDGY
jgi:hypothetical protein